MHLQQPDSAGPAPDKEPLSPADAYLSAALPFGQHLPLAAVNGPAYLTAQTVVQQVAYLLSDKVFAYSPDTFDLDLNLKKWEAEGELNAHGYAPGIQSSQIRAGAGSLALGYMFSKDFDLSRRHIPQSIVASSGALQHLRPALDQLSLLYSVANPVAAHVAAADYAAASSSGLVTDYATPMTLADELGLGLLSSSSSFEIQHMALLTTLFARTIPSLHVYDGINVGRESTQIADVLESGSLLRTYDSIAQATSNIVQKHTDSEGKIAKLLQVFNEELGTDYKLFEYYGHATAEHVLVVFGSVESSLSAQLAHALGSKGDKVGVINVRVYRPFVEEAFLEVLPSTVRNISVLGQVKDHAAVKDDAEHSRIYADVLAAVTFGLKSENQPSVTDVKHSRETVWSPKKMLVVMQQIQATAKSTAEPAVPVPAQGQPAFDLLGPSVKRYSFWDLDNAAAVNSPTAIAQLLSRDHTENIQLRTGFDNLARGGVIRSDIRCSSKSIEAPYAISGADIAFIGDESLLSDFDVPTSVRDGGRIIVRLPGAKAQETEKIEKRLPELFRKSVGEKGLQLFILDPHASTTTAENPQFENILLPVAFLRLTRDNVISSLGELAPSHENNEVVLGLAGDIDKTLWQFDVPSGWQGLEVDTRKVRRGRKDLNVNSFSAHDKILEEPQNAVKSSIAAAQSLAFKEVAGTKSSLRPDLTVKTFTVHVKERRRLTPESYDRNIFHIEFDLGDSGLTYAIGEALGIHQENDAGEVNNFISWYGLNPLDIVEVPSREDPNVSENRTIYQALMQNIDIFGRPPKRFYESLAEYASSDGEKKELLALGGPEGAVEFKRRAEVDTITYADILLEFTSAKPSFQEVVKLVAPLKRREYSIASSQKVTPNGVALLIVTVNWVDPSGRDRFGQATRYLNNLQVGAPVTVSVKPSVMKLPPKTTAPLIMAGLGTGLAPFRAFVQERAWQRQQGAEIGEVMLYMGSRHQREEYLYGEEWEAYRDAGIITHMGCAFSRDQPQKIYIQDRMRQTLNGIRDAYLQKEGSFYLCGPTWPVPDVTEVLQEAIEVEEKSKGAKKVDSRRAIEQLKDDARYVLEVY